jgi:hypothetical protein
MMPHCDLRGLLIENMKNNSNSDMLSTVTEIMDWSMFYVL